MNVNPAPIILTLESGSVKKVNPLIFGHFIEFMRDCIDEGMWAQLLKNRGFELCDHPENKLPDFWFKTGYKDCFHISTDYEQSIAKEGCSLKLTCFNHYDGYVGIAQADLCIQKATAYEGYIWLKALSDAAVTLELYDKEGHILLEKDFTVTAEWKKYPFHFSSDITTHTGIMEIKLKNNNSLWLDSTSLMPSNTANGIWKDVFSSIQTLHPSVIRFPGGCFADCYHWEDGIGERDSRPVRKNLHWGGYEDNSFGLDEYWDFCRAVGCEPMICVNFGSGTPEEAANWVEYCNGSVNTVYGALRAKYGHETAYHIKYWDIGNEIFGDWEIGHSEAVDYAKKYLAFYKAMKEKDPDITFMICGGDGDSRSQEWNREITKIIQEQMDVLCLHMYAQKEITDSTDNRDIYYATVGSVKKYEEILKDSYLTIRQNGSRNALAAITEYNVGTITDTYREQTLEAAIFNAGMLNMFIRNTEKLAMCNLSDLVNGWPGGCIVSKNGHTFGTATYYVISMYANSHITECLDTFLNSPVYQTHAQIGNIEPLHHIPYLDGVACYDNQHKLVLFVVNRSYDDPLELKIEFPGVIKKAELTTITSEKTSDMNHMDCEIIKPVISIVTLQNHTISLKKHSINRIRLL